MIRTSTLILAILTFTLSLCAQSDEVFVQSMVTFDHRIDFPSEEDLGIPFDELNLMYDRYLLEDFYAKISKQRKAYIVSQIGVVTSELIFQQMIYSKFSEDEIFNLYDRFDPMEFEQPYGRQIKKIAEYVKRKNESIGQFFPQLRILDSLEHYIKLPDVAPNEYILLHFWTSYCENCKKKLLYFSDHEEEFKAKNTKIINICTDYFPRNWKKVLKEKDYGTEQLYMNRVSFMDIAEKFTLELSSILLLDNTYMIVSRDKYKTEDLYDNTIVE